MNSFRVGLFLAIRQIRRNNFWTTLLIVFIMTLTFLNLVFVTGILVGLVEGSSYAYRTQYSGDVLISDLPEKSFIQHSSTLLSMVSQFPEVEAYTSRYLAPAVIEANYRNLVRPSDVPDQVSAMITGIDPSHEDQVTRLSTLVIEGEYLNPTDEGYVLIGSDLLKQYSRGPGTGEGTLENVAVGDRVRILLGNFQKEVRVKGIVKSKIQEVSMRVYFVDSELRKLLGRNDYNVDEIALKLYPGQSPQKVVQALTNQEQDKNALIRDWEQSQGTFFTDIKTTFTMLGNSIGAVALAVAAITIFIVIFINAVTRKKFIGILKGIGISGAAIEISYVMQSFFYALVGSTIGTTILYGFLEPFFRKNPINFPFSDGILSAPWEGTVVRVLVLLLTTLVAGYLPARMIVKKNTLDSILGR
ncbi:ABC transporter permease [Candidatus Nomurabacteria bacterium]|nr:ABC transporter permease [Candidatus Nomurabacteria bacterium]